MPINIQPDFVEISWVKSAERVDYYLFCYKSTVGLEKWKFVQTDSDNNRITFTGLMTPGIRFRSEGYLETRKGVMDQEMMI